MTGAKPVSLELLSKAAQLGGTVEGITWGDAGPAGAETGAHGATALHTIGDLGSGPARPGGGGRHRRSGDGGQQSRTPS